MLEDFRLRIFLTLAQQNSFTKAALALDVSQPAVSQSIAELEKNLGTKLFDRQRGEVTLTPAGELFRKYAEGILSQYQEAARVFLPLPEQIVTMSASDEMYSYVCDVLLKEFIQVHPEITFQQTASENADITFRSVPIDKKRGIFALSSDPSAYFAETKLWKLLLYFLKPSL